MKLCNKCQISKPLDCFYFCNSRNTYDFCCKDCRKIHYYIPNKDKIIKYHNAYVKSNIDDINKYQNEYKKQKRINNAGYKLRHNISASIGKILKYNGSVKDSSIINYFPYTFEELKQHLESLFEPWMNWNNYGKYNSKTWNDQDSATWKWSLDHIIPQIKLPYDSMDHPNFRKCWSLENLRPLSAKQNLIDGSRRKR